MADGLNGDEYVPDLGTNLLRTRIEEAVRRAATAHAAQAIHISQKTFGIDSAGTGDSLLFTR